MANTLPIIGAKNLGLTTRLPIWDYRLRFQQGSLVIFDTDTSATSVNYGLYFNPNVSKEPFDTAPGVSPAVDSDWMEIDFKTVKTIVS